LESRQNSSFPTVKRFFSGTVKKCLFFTLLCWGASYALFGSPFAAQAGILSFIGSIIKLEKQVTLASAPSPRLNSQNMALLAPAVNLDPNPSKGGGDIFIDDGALVPDAGPWGSAEALERPGSSQISIHIVREGETLSHIAELYDVSINTIAWANDIQGRVIHPGQELIILPITGVRYEVKKGDTLASIAKKFDGDLEEIANYNELAPDASLAAGSAILIPNGVIQVAAPSSATPSRPIGSSAPSVAGYFLWPVSGGIKTQGIHGYNGIDIGASAGTPIYAAAGGTVIVARSGGWNGGYGSYVVIQHNNGTQTLYAHASSVLVSQGEQVSQGEAIARVGSTGRSTGNHLHFEVRGAKNPF
jgi:LysM repeat protein